MYNFIWIVIVLIVFMQHFESQKVTVLNKWIWHFSF